MRLHARGKPARPRSYRTLQKQKIQHLKMGAQRMHSRLRQNGRLRRHYISGREPNPVQIHPRLLPHHRKHGQNPLAPLRQTLLEPKQTPSPHFSDGRRQAQPQQTPQRDFFEEFS